MEALRCAARGIADAAHRPRLVLLVWLVNLAFAALAALPVAVALARDLPFAPAGDALLDGFSFGLTAELARDAPGVAGAAQIAFIATALLALLVAPFLAAGVVETLVSTDDRSLAHRFGRGAGHFGGRFLRAGIAALPLAAGAAALLGGPWLFLRRRFEDTAHAEARWLLGLAGAAGAALGLLLTLVALDYARLEIARRDSRQPMRWVWRSLRFVLAHPLSTLGVGLANGLVLLAALGLYFALRGALPATTWPAIVAVIAAEQLLTLCRAGLRVALWSAETQLLDRLSPLAPPPTALQPSDAIESAAATLQAS